MFAYVASGAAGPAQPDSANRQMINHRRDAFGFARELKGTVAALSVVHEPVQRYHAVRCVYIDVPCFDAVVERHFRFDLRCQSRICGSTLYLIRALGNRLTDLCAGVSRAVDVDLSASGARGAFSRVRRSAIGKPVAEE